MEADESVSNIWKKWCRLCGREDPDNSNINVFIQDDTQTLDTTLATEIGKYFWVNIKLDDAFPTCICVDCHTLVNSLTLFTERVNKVQTMFCLLQNSNPENMKGLQQTKRQLGLLDEEWLHIMSKSVEKDHSVTVAIDINTENEIAEEIDEENMHLTKSDKNFKSRFWSFSENRGEETETELYEFVEEEFEKDTKKSEEAEFYYEDDAEEHNNLEDGTNESTVDESGYQQLKMNHDDADSVPDDQKLYQSSEEHLEYENEDSNYPPLQKKRRRGRPKKETNDVELRSEKKNSKQLSQCETDSDGSSLPKYECDVCNRRYKFPTVYRKHMLDMHNVEVDVPKYECDKCSKVLPTEKQYTLHMRSHLPLEEKLDIPCPYCDKKFSKASVMRLHVRGIHHNLKPYVCDQCGRSLKTIAALNEHKLVHTNECPYECDICHKRFKNKARLKVHSDIHKETEYVCNECGMTLNTRRTLKMHMLVHTDLKQYKCDFCDASFKRTKALKNHLILHTGMRPYKCPFCDKTFSNGSNCRSHKKKIHPKELALEEAQGKKSESVIVPKLKDLRSCSNIIENPRKVQRHSGGLPAHMRALLIAAEEREKQRNADKGNFNDITVEIQNCILNEEYEDETEETVVYEIIGEV